MAFLSRSTSFRVPRVRLPFLGPRTNTQTLAQRSALSVLSPLSVQIRDESLDAKDWTKVAKILVKFLGLVIRLCYGFHNTPWISHLHLACKPRCGFATSAPSRTSGFPGVVALRSRCDEFFCFKTLNTTTPGLNNLNKS